MFLARPCPLRLDMKGMAIVNYLSCARLFNGNEMLVNETQWVTLSLNIPAASDEPGHQATNRRAESGGGAVLPEGGGARETPQSGQCGQPRKR